MTLVDELTSLSHSFVIPSFQYKLIFKKKDGSTERTERKEADDEDVDVKQRGANSVVRFCIPADQLGQHVTFDSDPVFDLLADEVDENSGDDPPANYDPETGDFLPTGDATQVQSGLFVGVMSLLVFGKIFL